MEGLKRKKKPIGIYDALGFALGVVGMTFGDFCLLETDEFNAISQAYFEDRDATIRGEWERMRLLATISVQPHCKRKLSPEKLFSLPWDSKVEEGRQKALNKEDAKARFEKLMGMVQR